MEKFEILLSNKVENIMGMGKMARFEKISIWSNCFKKLPVDMRQHASGVKSVIARTNAVLT